MKHRSLYIGSILLIIGLIAISIGLAIIRADDSVALVELSRQPTLASGLRERADLRPQEAPTLEALLTDDELSTLGNDLLSRRSCRNRDWNMSRCS